MRLRQLGIACLVCLFYQGLAIVGPYEPPMRSEQARQLWEQGQEAMRAGEPDRAIALYYKSLEQDRARKENHLSLAAAYLQKGNEPAACAHLGLFLRSHPEHRNARFYHAELLLKLGRPGEAEGEFEQAIARTQEEPEPDLAHLVRCHTRMLEVGEALDEDYLIHLHRGIGLYLVARQRAALTDPEGELPRESLLCRATAALGRARALRPGEARPCWYLHAAWRQLAQHQPARRWLAEARRHAPFSYLTPAEQRDLTLACRALLDAMPR
jgi:tetratricopeptide (TPR) repeat protein